jgi:hypothetical protein
MVSEEEMVSGGGNGGEMVSGTVFQNNQLTAIGNTTVNYDPAGDMLNDGNCSYTYDGEQRMASATCGGVTTYYVYDGEGQRVRDVTTSNTTDEAYGVGGSLLWRYTGSSSDPNQRAFVPLGGRLLAEYYSGGTIFDHPDEIGSMATSSDYTGNNFNEKLFYPFGELWTGAAIPNLNMHQTFAQLPDYDSETDQYNTPNRHYNPTGRWLSPGKMVSENGVRNHFLIREKAIALGYGQSEASGCWRYDLSCPEPRELPFSAVPRSCPL